MVRFRVRVRVRSASGLGLGSGSVSRLGMSLVYSNINIRFQFKVHIRVSVRLMYRFRVQVRITVRVRIRFRPGLGFGAGSQSLSGLGLVDTVGVKPAPGYGPIPSRSQDKSWAEGWRPYSRSHGTSLKLVCEHDLPTRPLTTHQPDPAWGISTHDGMASSSLHSDSQTPRGTHTHAHTHTYRGGDLGLHPWIRRLGVSDSEPHVVTF